MLLKKTLFLCLVLPAFSFGMEEQPRQDAQNERPTDIYEELFKAAALGNNAFENAAKVLLTQGRISEKDYRLFREGIGNKWIKPALRDGWIQHWRGFGEGFGKGAGEVVSEVGKILVVPVAQGFADRLYGTSLEQQIQLRTLQSQLMAQKMPFIQQKIHGYQETIDLCVKELSHDHLDAATRAFWTEEKTKAENELRKLEQRSQKHIEHELENIDFTLNLLERNSHKGLAGTIAAWWNKPAATEDSKENTR